MCKGGYRTSQAIAAGLVYLAVVAAAFDAWAVVAVLAILAGGALAGGAR